MRTAFHLAGLAVLTAAATVPAQSQQRDWTRTAAATPEGGYLIGNPAAATRIVEYASYTCPHCAHFAGWRRARGFSRSGGRRA